MADDEILWLCAQTRLTLSELEEASGLPVAVLRELVELGALRPADPQSDEWIFGGDCVVRVRAARRLRDDLELETGVFALVLSFLERIEALERELSELRAAIPRGQ